MKKIIYLIILLLIMPIAVSAEGVGPVTATREFVIPEDGATGAAVKTKCIEETININLPAHVKNATTGFLLTCAVVNCDTSKLVYEYVEHPNKIISCANGNTKPWFEESSNPIGAEYPQFADCDIEEFEEKYTGLKYQFDCTRDENGTPFVTSNENIPTTPAQGGNNNAGTTQNPQTNINTYYVVLSVAVLLLSLALYVVNKKNVFKKM